MIGKEEFFPDESDLFPAKSGKKLLRLKEGQHLIDVPIREGMKKNLTIKVWGAISYSGTGPLIRYEDTMKAQKYIEILETHLLQTYPELRNQEVEKRIQIWKSQDSFLLMIMQALTLVK